MELGVSVVICTYNGAALIPDTIKHLAQQRVNNHLPWEVIIIDNASTDNTSEVAKQEWQKYNIRTPFSLMHQPQQGLTYARKMALENARYEFVLFCDDDNWLSQDYVSNAYNIMLHNANIGVLGGLGELVYEVEPPEWTLAFTMFGNGPQERASGKVQRNKVYGAGCVIRRSAINRILNAGYIPLLTDRVAGNLSSGGDHELCYILAMTGYDIWYDERLRFKHYMPKKRVEWNYYERFFNEASQSIEVIIPYEILLNHNAQSTYSFYIKLLYILLYNLKELNLLILNIIKVPAGSCAAKINALKLKKLKERIWNLRKYRVMKSNFEKILSFKKSFSHKLPDSNYKLLPQAVTR